MTDKYKQAYLGLIVGVTAVSSAAIFVRLATAPSSVIAAYRLIFTVLILSIPTFLFHRKELKRVTLREWKYSFLSGVFLAFHFITWFESLKYTSVASSVVLVTLQPIFAMLGIYIIFKQKISLFGILGAVLALTGSFIIGWGDFKIGGMALYGDFLALIGAILVTGYWLVGQSLRRNLSLFPYTFIVYSSSSLVLILYNLLFRFEMLTYDKKNWIIFFALAIIPTIMGHTLFNWTLKYINAATVSTVNLAEPVGAAILAYYVLGEGVSMSQIIGGIVILSGILIYLKFK